MKKILIILLSIATLSGCTGARHFVIGIGMTDLGNGGVTEKVKTKIFGVDFLNKNNDFSFGIGYHENIIHLTNIDNITTNKYEHNKTN